jgi:hypothetical protein
MTTEKLSFEQWKELVAKPQPIEVLRELSAIHGIDVTIEIEAALRKEYEWYLTL